MSAGHGGRRRAKKHEEEEHENHERWMVSYADMMTLLLVLFIVLYAMSQVDKQKFAALASGLSESFGGPISVTPAASPERDVLDGLPDAIDIASAIPPDPSVQDTQVDAAAVAAAADDAALVEAIGGSVRVVEAPADNIKITRAVDIEVAEALLRSRSEA